MCIAFFLTSTSLMTEAARRMPTCVSLPPASTTRWISVWALSVSMQISRLHPPVPVTGIPGHSSTFSKLTSSKACEFTVSEYHLLKQYFCCGVNQSIDRSIDQLFEKPVKCVYCNHCFFACFLQPLLRILWAWSALLEDLFLQSVKHKTVRWFWNKNS